MQTLGKMKQLTISAQTGTENAVELLERPKGRWVDRFGGKYENKLYECSLCHKNALHKYDLQVFFREGFVQVLSDYCPTAVLI